MNVGNLINAVKECQKHLAAYGNPNSQRIAMAVALGRAISLSLPLPATLVDNIGYHYNQMHDMVVNRVVSQINEVYIVDTSLVRVVALTYYTFRYELVYSPAVHADLIDRLVVLRDQMFPPAINEFVRPLSTNSGLATAMGELMTITQVLGGVSPVCESK